MEKINSIKYNIFILLLTVFFFLWDVFLLNFNLKFLILFAYLFVILDYKKFIKKFYNYKLLIFLFIFIHLYIGSDFNFSSYLFKSYIFLFLISCLVIFYKYEILLILENSIYFFIFILISILIFYTIFSNNYENLNYFVNFFNQKKILFSESSHFAMISASIIIYSLNKFVLTKKKIYLSIFLIILSVGYLNFSLSLFAGIFLSSFFIIITNYISLKRIQKISFIMLMLVSAVSIYANYTSFNKIIFLKKYLTKNLKDERINLSVEVFFTSHKIMLNSIKEKPFGYGFNNYEQAFTEHINKIEYSQPIITVLNKKDASNNFAKIITEAGIFSLIIMYFVIYFSFSNKINLNYKLIIIPNFLVQTFIRGAGYFNGGYIIYLILIIFLVLDIKFKNKKVTSNF